MMNSVSNQTFQLSIVDFIPEAAENQSPLFPSIFILNLVFSSLIIVFSNFISRISYPYQSPHNVGPRINLPSFFCSFFCVLFTENDQAKRPEGC